FLLRHTKGETDGGAKIENGFLICTREAKQDKPNGIISVKPCPDFSPKGAFKFTADFKFEEGLHRQGIMATLFDNKYVTVPNKENQKKYHKGFQISFRVYPNDKYVPRAAFGFGDKSKEISGKTVTLEKGKLHHIEVYFNAKGQVKITINGKEVGSGEVPEGPIAASTLATVIGDRYGSSYAVLGGAISKVALYNVEEEAAPAPEAGK
ncbi:MAG: hypothetical protein J5746_12015, partial [Victivallales bacterium]|nr:hypothetical protein [Victivallales bacterium]